MNEQDVNYLAYSGIEL